MQGFPTKGDIIIVFIYGPSPSFLLFTHFHHLHIGHSFISSSTATAYETLDRCLDHVLI